MNKAKIFEFEQNGKIEISSRDLKIIKGSPLNNYFLYYSLNRTNNPDNKISFRVYSDMPGFLTSNLPSISGKKDKASFYYSLGIVLE